ncbi:MAG: hypothetical protein QGG71_11520 [Pirellulaceae bacterium]|jgi:hypothetical protein|nr:hypothetical protein [Planctomycetaceae bacterium]MDP6555284.1 hypothetical protein [Pirellulaceae bacterium]
MNLSWRVHETATVLHVAAAIARDLPLSDPRIAHALETLVKALQDEINQIRIPNEDAWNALCAHACHLADAPQLVRAALPITDQSEARRQQERMIQLITKLGEETRRVLPGLGDELRHRSRPLREQWDARGPGLLHSLRSTTDHRLYLAHASVFVVHPILGGNGAVDPVRAALRIEALLTNTVPGLPEVVRLGWLLGQLACHQMLNAPIGQPACQRNCAVELAMVPATLAAAETVELAVCNAQTVRQAITAWQHGPSDEDASVADDKAHQLWKWWQSLKASTPWDCAVVELSERL